LLKARLTRYLIVVALDPHLWAERNPSVLTLLLDRLRLFESRECPSHLAVGHLLLTSLSEGQVRHLEVLLIDRVSNLLSFMVSDLRGWGVGETMDGLNVKVLLHIVCFVNRVLGVVLVYRINDLLDLRSLYLVRFLNLLGSVLPAAVKVVAILKLIREHECIESLIKPVRLLSLKWRFWLQS
jgi:hypothetical protein